MSAVINIYDSYCYCANYAIFCKGWGAVISSRLP
jgi:hypothetical protein